MKPSEYASSQYSPQSRQEIVLTGRIERSFDWLFPAFVTAGWFGALFVILKLAEKADKGVIVFALVVGLGLLVNLLRKLNIMSLFAFRRRAELVLPLSSIKAGDEFEVLFRQELKLNLEVKNIKATLYGEIIDNRSSEIEHIMAHTQTLSPDKFQQHGKLIEARRIIKLPERLAHTSKYENLPITWRIMVSVKLQNGPKCICLFYLPAVGMGQNSSSTGNEVRL
jgi:hypothetical protein